MRVRVKTSELKAKTCLPTSKSLLHRYLIVGSRSDFLNIRTNSLSKDVQVTIDILKSLGSKIVYENGLIKIRGYEANLAKKLDFFESGSSLRFLLPYAFLEERKLEFICQPALADRPIKELIDQLENHGVNFSSNKLPFFGRGKLSGGSYVFSGNKSSQYISGLMMVAPFIDDELEIAVTGDFSSFPYIKMTRDVMYEAGVKIELDRFTKKIRIPKKRYDLTGEIEVEGDWSNAIVPIALGILKGEMVISGLFEDSIQGDSRIVEILKDQGADINWVNKELIIKKSQLRGFDMDIDDHIDLFPVLSVLALSCNEESRFRNISRLRYKESDRIESVLALHKAIGAKSFVDGDSFIVSSGPLHSANVSSFNDHRIVMAAIVSSAVDNIVLEIDNFEAIDKSYPGFISNMQDLGLSIGVIDEKMGQANKN